MAMLPRGRRHLLGQPEGVEALSFPTLLLDSRVVECEDVLYLLYRSA
jgi:hypothetical protein